MIRIFNGESGWIKCGQVRRGMDQAEIYSISFSATGDKICVGSDKGTIHIFNINISPHLTSQCSFVKFSLPVECKYICAFVERNMNDRSEIIIVCEDGSIYFCSFDNTIGGEFRKDHFERLDFGN